jgi:uncharacterized DUF497 family protein
MEITWDDRKAEANFKKHGVTFDEASTVIMGQHFYNLNDYPSGNRFEYIGYSVFNRVIYVVTIEEQDDRIHILSARKATPNERRKHEEGI